MQRLFGEHESADVNRSVARQLVQPADDHGAGCSLIHP
jgi:hypothetical protein